MCVCAFRPNPYHKTTTAGTFHSVYVTKQFGTASLVSPVKTHLATLPSQGGPLRTGKSDVYQQPIAGLTHRGSTQRECGFLCLDVVLCSLLSHALSQVHRRQKQLELESRKGDFRRDEEVLDAPEELRQPVLGVGGTQEEQGREWLAL